MKSSASPKFEKLQQLARTVPGLDADRIWACVPLLYLQRELEAALDQHYQALGLSRGRWQVLVTLYKADAAGLTPAELAEESGVTRAAMTGLVDALVDAGHVARGEQGEDRRTYRVRLTPAGTDFVASVLPDHMRRMQALLEPFSAAERQLLVTLIEKLRGRLHVFRHTDGAPPEESSR